MYDVIVVGARCAGAPTALLLARRGYRVLLVDQAAFPSDTVSTHYVKLPGARALHRWGLLDVVLATNCPPVLARTIHREGEEPLVGDAPPPLEIAGEVGPRRTVLDTLLVEAAVRAGVELRERFTFEDVLWDDGRVRGIRGRARGGSSVTEHARLVVGADGRRSLVARAVRAAAVHEVPPLTFGYYAYWADLPLHGVEGGRSPSRRCMFVALPTNDGLSMVLVQAAVDHLTAFCADIAGSHLQALELAPAFAERVRAARRVEPFRGSVDLINVIRRAHGPGWALVGDAGFCQDPFRAQGILDAFLDVERLVRAIDAGLSGQRPLDDALATYEEERDAVAFPSLAATCRVAQFLPERPEERLLRTALRADPLLAGLFVGIDIGTVTPAEFCAQAPAHIRQLFEAIRAPV